MSSSNLTDERLSRRNIETGDVFIADAVEMLDQGAEAVAVSRRSSTRLPEATSGLIDSSQKGITQGDGVLQSTRRQESSASGISA